MEVRGAPLIGATAAYGLVLAIIENNDQSFLKKSADELISSRPTAINLKWAVDRMMNKLSGLNSDKILEIALNEAKEVDMCIVGTDRTLANGDVCNKIGTYLKALAAHDNNIPFYVALPSSTIDWNIKDHKDIPIEERNSEELSHVEGLDEKGNIKKIQIYPKNSKAMNLAFDVTPAKYVTGLITEKGICEASERGLKELFK